MALHKKLSSLIRGDHPPFCKAMRSVPETQQPKVNYHDKFVNAKSVKQNNHFLSLTLVHMMKNMFLMSFKQSVFGL